MNLPLERRMRALRVVRFRTLAVLFVALVAAIGAVAQPSQEAEPYSQDELDQLVAPIALYPDDLLVQILAASTYPLEVVEAARFVQQNPDLRGDALDSAVMQRNWDASVQSLTAFPQVLAMMSDKLEWTERLGDVFLGGEQRVMDTVQALRKHAQAAGNLASTLQQTVADDNGAIAIEPARPEVVYVPVYDPTTVYGPWWAPGYPPWFWYPPPIYGYPVVIAGVAFGIGWPLSRAHWGWGRADWRRHQIVLNVGQNLFWNRPNRPLPVAGQPWQHSPYHRRGVPYVEAQTRQRFQPVSPAAVRERENYRGYGAPLSPARAPIVRQTQPATPPRIDASRPAAPSVFDPGVSRDQERINAQRGVQSLQTRPAPNQPATRVPSAPSPPVTRMPSAPARQSMPATAPRPATPATAPRPAPVAPARGR
jgi:hypothetical protein